MISRKDVDVRGPTPIYRDIVDSSLAWTPATLGGKAGLVQQLSAAELQAVDETLRRTRYLAPHAVTRQDFDHPVLNAMLEDLNSLLADGRGAAILRGISRERYSKEDCERIFWGFGTHLGEAAIQSATGERMGHVRFEQVNPHNRGFRDRIELRPHTDSYAIVGLMCLEAAASGGESQLVSTLAMHNEFVRNKPHLLEALYRGYPTAIYEARHWKDPVTDFDIPIFSCVDGKISCLYTPLYLREASEQMGTPLPPLLAEAIAYLQELSTREDLKLEFMLEPGEMMIWNNYILLHSRSAFSDSETHRRHLLRLWLRSNCRPVLPELHTWGLMYERLFRERTAAA
jgi:TfdA family taurine catabolism dioxygenase TauD